MNRSLNQAEIEKKLKQLPVEWSQAGNSLERTYEFSDFNQGLKFTNKVGKIADDLNHHPVITLEWGKVVITLSTHESGGITETDFGLAAQIDRVYDEVKET